MRGERLLKVGVAMSAVAVLAAVGVALMIVLGGSPSVTRALTAERAAEKEALLQPEPRSVTPPKRREEASLPPEPQSVTLPERRETTRSSREGRPEEPRTEARPEEPRTEAPQKSKVPRRPKPTPPAVDHEPPREATPNGPSVSYEELAAANRPRHYGPRRDAVFTLTVEALGVYDVPVANEAGDAALDRGAIHLPDTQMPWDEGEHKNVYIAGHRLGYPGTDSRLLFYHLDRLRPGDKVVLKGRGKVFRYRVSEILVVNPSDRWAKAPVHGRDMVSLQTCTPIPTFEKRLIVRGDRI